MKGRYFNYKDALKKPLEVKQLYLSGYKESDLSKLHLFKNLEFLELKDFKSIVLPDSLINLKGLKKLCLTDNMFLEIPKIIFKLNLTTLNIYNGNIKRIPEEISNLTYLSNLHLSNLHKLQELPKTVTDLENLKYLNLQRNNLRKLPIDIGNLQRLEHLDIAYNNSLKTLPISFARLNLKKFYAGFTPFYTNLGNKQKKILELLKQFNQRGENLEKREMAFQMFLEDDVALEDNWEISEILELLNFYNQIIRQNTLVYLHNKTSSPFQETKTKPLHLRVIGKAQSLGLSQYLSNLKEHKIFVERRWNDKVNLIFVGEYPKKQLEKALETKQEIFPITYLKDFLNTLEKPYLTNNDPETVKMAESLADLLRSEEENNQELGLEMALGGGINEVYFYDLLLLYIWNRNRKIKNMASEVLEKYLPSQTFIHLKNNCKNYYENPAEDTITQYLESLTDKSIDPNKLGYIFYQATARGKKFCLKYGEAFKKVVQNEIKNSVLHLNNLSLTELNPEIAHFKFLKMLYLSKNRLKTLPQSFNDLYKLKLLVLSSNQFKTIPTVVFGLKKLRNLDFSKNKIENISEEIENLSSLVNLNLSSNNIKDLPLSIERLRNLRSLNISKNPIVRNREFIRKLSDLLPNCMITF